MIVSPVHERMRDTRLGQCAEEGGSCSGHPAQSEYVSDTSSCAGGNATMELSHVLFYHRGHEAETVSQVHTQKGRVTWCQVAR